MTPAFATIDALRESLGKPEQPTHSDAYVAKMMHPVPASTVVDRTVFLLQQVAGKRVLEFGASGPMHDGIVKAAAFVHGVDIAGGPNVEAFDLDAVEAYGSLDMSASLIELPWGPFDDLSKPDVIVCGEIIEHLANPGFFLKRLKAQYDGVPVIITVPNAFTAIGAKHIKTGIENVNKNHCSYYSYTTLKELLGRYGYEVKEFFWYNGAPFTAEGLIVVAQ